MVNGFNDSSRNRYRYSSGYPSGKGNSRLGLGVDESAIRVESNIGLQFNDERIRQSLLRLELVRQPLSIYFSTGRSWEVLQDMYLTRDGVGGQQRSDMSKQF